MRHRPNRYQELSLRRVGRYLWHVQLSSLLEFTGSEGFWNGLLSSKDLEKIFKLTILSSFPLGLTKMMLGKIEDRRRRGQQRMRWLDGIINSVDMCLKKSWEIVKDREAWCTVVHVVTKSQT